jgi:hypothetical protein
MNAKATIKHATRQLVYTKIENALADIKQGIKGKKFEKDLKKASKILAKDISKAAQAAEKKTKQKKDKSSAAENKSPKLSKKKFKVKEPKLKKLKVKMFKESKPGKHEKAVSGQEPVSTPAMPSGDGINS